MPFHMWLQAMHPAIVALRVKFSALMIQDTWLIPEAALADALSNRAAWALDPLGDCVGHALMCLSCVGAVVPRQDILCGDEVCHPKEVDANSVMWLIDAEAALDEVPEIVQVPAGVPPTPAALQRVPVMKAPPASALPPVTVP